MERTSPKYCQVISEPYRIARLAFCERCIEDSETLDDVIFADESRIKDLDSKPWENLFQERGHADQIKAQSKTSVEGAHVGWHIKTRCNTDRSLHGHHEGRFLH